MTFSSILSIRINLLIFFILAIGSIIFISKLKLDQKGYRYLFLVYTFFWVPIMLVRPYRGTMQNVLDPTFTAIVLAVYGAIGIIVRVFADVFNYWFKKRKAFLYLCVVCEFALFIPLIITPNTATNILEAIGIGIGASCIGTYELLFREQYGNKKAFLTVSVLSIPPLLANFLTAPIQSIFKTVSLVSKPDGMGSVIDPNTLRYMWVVALIFIVITFILLVFMKEHRGTFKPLKNQQSQIVIDKKTIAQNWIFFLSLALIGSIITFVKFTNSDGVATLHIQNLASLNQTSSASYEGYLSVVFSIFQLIAGVLMGMWMINRFSLITNFLIGASCWIVYCISVSFISNPIGYISIHGINGFGYGILYNLVLGLILKISLDDKMITKMGLYQSILAIGITVSGFYTTWVKEAVIGKVNVSQMTLNEYMKSYFIQNMILLGIVVLMCLGFVTLIITQNKITGKQNYSDNERRMRHHLS